MRLFAWTFTNCRCGSLVEGIGLQYHNMKCLLLMCCTQLLLGADKWRRRLVRRPWLAVFGVLAAESTERLSCACSVPKAPQRAAAAQSTWSHEARGT